MRPEDQVHFCPPGRIVIGCGARTQLPALLHRLGYTIGVLVTDTFFTTRTPWVKEYVGAAQAMGIRTVVFDGGLPDPTTTLCDDATSAVRTPVSEFYSASMSSSAAVASGKACLLLT